jgi:hypothetical protein
MAKKAAANVERVTPVNVSDEARAKISAVAKLATPDERQAVTNLVERAKTGKRGVEMVTITPGMAAILFLEHNDHNRDWRADGAKSCMEFVRRMNGGAWRWNNATIGFYNDGKISDGQHRLSACAVAGYTWEVGVVFGTLPDSINTVDDCVVRHGADHAKLSGIQNAKVKQAVIKSASSYMVKCGDRKAALNSEAEVHAAIVQNNDMLEEAIAIGTVSMQHVVEPVLKGSQTFAVVYLLLSNGWPKATVGEKLALFQTGVSTEGDKSPYFVAAEVIKTARKKIEAKDKLNSSRELGCAIFALSAAELGTKAIPAATLRGTVKKELPNPAFPTALPLLAQAAE